MATRVAKKSTHATALRKANKRVQKTCKNVENRNTGGEIISATQAICTTITNQNVANFAPRVATFARRATKKTRRGCQNGAHVVFVSILFDIFANLHFALNRNTGWGFALQKTAKETWQKGIVLPKFGTRGWAFALRKRTHPSRKCQTELVFTTCWNPVLRG